MRLIVTVGWSIYPLGYFFGSHGQCPGRHSEFREQDRILPCHLEFCQEVHPGKGRCPPPTVRSPINLIIEAWCRISTASRYLLLAFQFIIDAYHTLKSCSLVGLVYLCR